MNGITAVVLTYNEEKRIANVLESLKAFDAVLVMDKSSTDRTREIAESYGAVVVTVPYSDEASTFELREKTVETSYTMFDNEWLFSVVASDIIHKDLYSEMLNAIKAAGEEYEVIEVPIYRYSMGVIGKNSYYGGLKYQADLSTRHVRKENLGRKEIIHEDPNRGYKKYRMNCKDEKVAVYHLTHERLDLIMDRHLRYSAQYVTDWEKNGKSREDIMRYAWHECVRVVFAYFKLGMFKLKKVGMAQCMMLLMYNAMIYLHAFFSKEQEEEIKAIYKEICDNCKGETK
ncbi:MAG: glycosyltransferase [Clostridia bacterium]|nr:glycosyltransferase [Clostridia bacterium]